MSVPPIHAVHKSINRPLTIAGVERKLFFFALVMGAATFNLFSRLLSGILMFACLYLFARWATATDPEILAIIFRASRFKVQYDPARQEPYVIRRIPNHGEPHTRS